MTKTAETPRPQGPQRVEDAPPWPHHWCVAKYNGDFFLSRSDADLAYYRDLSQWYDAQLAQSQAALSASEAALAEARTGTCGLEWCNDVIAKLQRALAFWHPGVGGREDDAFLTRAGDDAMLLFGYDGPTEQSAKELGWIEVRDAAKAGEKP